MDVDLPGAGRPATPAGTASGSQGLSRAAILEVLEQTGWRIRGERGAAALVGLKPTTLEARMATLGIKRP